MRNVSVKSVMASLRGSIGVIADVQYVDKDDGFDFSGKQRRRYRNSLKVLERAVGQWKEVKVDTVIQLGDLVDGQAKALGKSEHHWKTCSDTFKSLECNEIVNLLGNHELYNFSRHELVRLDVIKEPNSWYSYKPYTDHALRLVILDAFDISTIQGSTQDKTDEAFSYLAKKNPNDIWHKGVNWSEGLVGDERRFLPYNGALGEEQMTWLRGVLQASRDSSEKVIVLSHVPMYGSDPRCLLWNYDEVLQTLKEFQTEVLAVLAGHDHEGSYSLLDNIHHLTLPSPLLCQEDDEHCHGILKVHQERLQWQWTGPKLPRDIVMTL